MAERPQPYRHEYPRINPMERLYELAMGARPTLLSGGSDALKGLVASAAGFVSDIASMPLAGYASGFSMGNGQYPGKVMGELPFGSRDWGRRMGANVDSTGFMLGEIGSPDPHDAAVLAPKLAAKVGFDQLALMAATSFGRKRSGSIVGKMNIETPGGSKFFLNDSGQIEDVSDGITFSRDSFWDAFPDAKINGNPNDVALMRNKISEAQWASSRQKIGALEKANPDVASTLRNDYELGDISIQEYHQYVSDVLAGKRVVKTNRERIAEQIDDEIAERNAQIKPKKPAFTVVK